MTLTVTEQDSNHKGEHSKSTAEEADVSSTTWPDRLPGEEACGIVCSPVCCVEDTSPLSRGHGTNLQTVLFRSVKITKEQRN